MRVSIVVPCFNAEAKIARCLMALADIAFGAGDDHEVIFVDDASEDATPALIERACALRPHWRLVRLPANSGSPSRPRNVGVDLARGEYVFFLDCDDEILPDALSAHHACAAASGADVVRGYLLADDGRTRMEMNRLPEWHAGLTRRERIELLIGRQSSTVPGLYRRALLVENEIKWRDDIRMGEDTMFLVAVLRAAAAIEYVDHPTFIYNKAFSFTYSATQLYRAKDLRDHLAVWRTAQDELEKEGLSYARCRLHVGLRTALNAMIFRRMEPIDEATFAGFSEFVTEYWESIGRYAYGERLRTVLAAVRAGDFAAFNARCRPRLVIAGHDLKFSLAIAERLGAWFDVRFDEWRGHERHDESASRQLLDWADLIWCEWLLGNAVWYASNRREDQRLVVRLHRFELSREFGDQLRVENVDAVVAVSTLFFERVLERFPAIPRAKMRLIPNGVETEAYARRWSPDRSFTLAMIGILPARKNLHVALAILAALRRHDPRYRLEIFGTLAEDLPWLARQSQEVEYYDRCRAAIVRDGLEDAVRFHGHSDIPTALEQHGVGFVLSVSESMPGFPGFESFHVSVLDGFAAGAVSLILHWGGAEYIYPADYICGSVDEIVERIRAYSADPERHRADAETGRQFVAAHYDALPVADAYRRLFIELS
jgi:glycosyltransferase involved in cell wall biosynthesis